MGENFVVVEGAANLAIDLIIKRKRMASEGKDSFYPKEPLDFTLIWIDVII